MILDQYPDILLREGDLPSSGLPCRFIPNKGKGIVKGKDGAEVEANYVVAMPLDTPTLLIGEIINAIDSEGDHIVFNEPIALFHRGQLHCKAYV